MQVTRRQILRAIRTEKLKPGSFLHEKRIRKGFEEYDYVSDKTCKVCAVGAVLRVAGVKNELIDSLGYSVCKTSAIDSAGDEEASIQEGDFMGALSVKFEKLAEKHGTGKRTREKLCKFVKDNFPKKVKLDT